MTDGREARALGLLEELDEIGLCEPTREAMEPKMVARILAYGDERAREALSDLRARFAEEAAMPIDVLSDYDRGYRAGAVWAEAITRTHMDRLAPREPAQAGADELITARLDAYEPFTHPETGETLYRRPSCADESGAECEVCEGRGEVEWCELTAIPSEIVEKRSACPGCTDGGPDWDPARDNECANCGGSGQIGRWLGGIKDRVVDCTACDGTGRGMR